MEYKFTDIEKKWQDYWKKNDTYKVETDSSKPKYYVLDMFPYPSGSGLHVGHPLGYIASDIFSRYKKHCGYNVLHPMGFDAFGLPAEQYAIQTGRHPAATTEENIRHFKEQLGAMGFNYDWNREVKTCEPGYYKWTQWIFLRLFDSWYNKAADKAESIDTLVKIFSTEGNMSVNAATDYEFAFSEDEWKDFDEQKKQEILMSYRLAYLSYAEVNWCPELGTVLANDEVKDGRSERGGHPVIKKKMRQWFLRITAYAERLLKDLDTLAWSDSMKEMQRNWIGRSEGALVFFDLPEFNMQLEIYTTRPDTIFGVTFMVLAPEHPLVDVITSPEHAQEVLDYRNYVQSRSERERQSEVKKVTGAFTGALAVNPFTGEKIPVFISEYVLMGYGTGAIMAVPSDDDRDNAFATHFNLPIIDVIDKGMYPGATRDDKLGKMINSGFINGMEVLDAIEAVNAEIDKREIGKRMVQYRLRDAIFGRQRYWGEPIPVYYKADVPYALDEKDLPLLLPQMDDFKPSEDGEPPLAKVESWRYVPEKASPPSPLQRRGESGQSYVASQKEEGEPGYHTADKKSWEVLKEQGRELRKNQTEAEEILWEKLRDNQTGHKIRRQHAIDIFIADFVCLSKKVVIEVDGGIHLDAEQKEYDKNRTYELGQRGFEVIRFTNDEAIKGIDEVVKKIKAKLDSKVTTKEYNSSDSPSPSERGAGGEATIGSEGYPLETTTMPGWAGSSWYFLRYMDPRNDKAFISKEAEQYWQDVDLYIGGTEHAVGHLLYARFWQKFLYDRGYVSKVEPFKKLVNQGMITGVSKFALRLFLTHLSEEDSERSQNSAGLIPKMPAIFISKKIFEEIYNTKEDDEATRRYHFENHPEIIKVQTELNSEAKGIYNEFIGEFKLQPHVTSSRVDVKYVDGDYLIINDFKSEQGLSTAKLILESDGKYICSSEVEKMSKSKLNVVNPDDIIAQYGADTFRMYEMFLGPIEQSKPWNTNGIDGVSKFVRKLWRLFYSDSDNTPVSPSPAERGAGGEANKAWLVKDEPATEKELKVIHKTIKKVSEDIERMSFNTCISTFMVCVNELQDLKCNKKEVLQDLVVLIAPFAPHVAEELWEALGNTGSVTVAAYPKYNEKYLVESAFEYPVSINGKLRTKINLPLDLLDDKVQQEVLASDVVQKWLEGKPLKKFIYVPGKIINIVV